MKRQGCHIAKAFFLRFVLPQLPGLRVAGCAIALRKRPELLLIPFMFLGSTSMLQVLAQQDTVDSWDYSIYNWKNAAYEHLGNQNHCGGSTGLHTFRDDSGSFLDWRWNQYNANGDGTKSDYVNPTTREIRIQLASSNASSHEDMDWISLAVYTSSGSGTIFNPPTNFRWQYQLSASAADGTSYPSTQGINTVVCALPFTGCSCVEPMIIDFDFYEDASLTVSNNFLYTTALVKSLHAMGKKAIGYVDAADTE